MSVTSPPGHCRGIDGKVYRNHPLSADDRQWLIARVHYLSHDGALPVRKIRAAILSETSAQPSIGWISQVLRQHPCERCSGVSKS